MFTMIATCHKRPRGERKNTCDEVNSVLLIEDFRMMIQTHRSSTKKYVSHEIKYKIVAFLGH